MMVTDGSISDAACPTCSPRQPNLLKTNGSRVGTPFGEGTAKFEMMREWNRLVVYRRRWLSLQRGWRHTARQVDVDCTNAVRTQASGRRQPSRHDSPMPSSRPSTCWSWTARTCGRCRWASASLAWCVCWPARGPGSRSTSTPTRTAPWRSCTLDRRARLLFNFICNFARA